MNSFYAQSEIVAPDAAPAVVYSQPTGMASYLPEPIATAYRATTTWGLIPPIAAAALLYMRMGLIGGFIGFYLPGALAYLLKRY